MKSSVTKIGNSKGIIIPAHLLKQCGFTKEVSLEIKNDTLVISKAKKEELPPLAVGHLRIGNESWLSEMSAATVRVAFILKF